MKIKKKITEGKSSGGGFNSRMEVTEERISELEDKTAEIKKLNSRKNQAEKRKAKRNVGDLCDDGKAANIHVLRIPEGEKEGNGANKALKEIMVEKFPILARDINLHIQEAE